MPFKLADSNFEECVNCMGLVTLASCGWLTLRGFETRLRSLERALLTPRYAIHHKLSLVCYR